VSKTGNKDLLENGDEIFTVNDMCAFIKKPTIFENLIAVDNTASVNFVTIISFIEAGFDLVSCNTNTLSFDFFTRNGNKIKEYKKNNICTSSMLVQVYL
jgi:hypothetical protein